MRKILAAIGLCLISAIAAQAADITPDNAGTAFAAAFKKYDLARMRAVKTECNTNALKASSDDPDPMNYICVYRISGGIDLYVGARKQSQTAAKFDLYFEPKHSDPERFLASVVVLIERLDPQLGAKERARIATNLITSVAREGGTTEPIENWTLTSSYNEVLGLNIKAKRAE